MLAIDYQANEEKGIWLKTVTEWEPVQLIVKRPVATRLCIKCSAVTAYGKKTTKCLIDTDNKAITAE